MTPSVKRKWLTLALLCGPGMALAQSELVASTAVPDAAACVKLVTLTPRPFPPALETAVRSTAQAYSLQEDRLTALVNRNQDFRDRQELERLGQEADTYLGRLLSRYGWPTDPALQTSFGLLLNDARLQFCSGQAALKAAITQDERRGAASLIDRGLLGLGQGQRYGTVSRTVGLRLWTQPIDDAPNVDVRRAVLGLPPLVNALAEAAGRVTRSHPAHRPETSGGTAGGVPALHDEGRSQHAPDGATD